MLEPLTRWCACAKYGGSHPQGQSLLRYQPTGSGGGGGDFFEVTRSNLPTLGSFTCWSSCHHMCPAVDTMYFDFFQRFPVLYRSCCPPLCRCFYSLGCSFTETSWQVGNTWPCWEDSSDRCCLCLFSQYPLCSKKENRFQHSGSLFLSIIRLAEQEKLTLHQM